MRAFLLFVTLFVSLGAWTEPLSNEIVSHQMKVALFPMVEGGYLTITDSLESAKRPNRFTIPQVVTDLTLFYEGVETPFEVLSGGQKARFQKIKPLYGDGAPEKGVLTISYSFKPVFEDHEGGGMGHDQISDEVDAVILDVGVYLAPTSYWYPYVETPFEKFEIEVSSPSGWATMTSGTLASSEELDGWRVEKWSINHPSEPIHFIANQFSIYEEVYRGVKLQTYFHSEVSSHSDAYIQKLKSYLDLYLDFFGNYPYDKFAVVSNFFSTGYGMASYTLLDKNIIPFPFIVDISLGHELLHNYWGNSVYVDYSWGNWCEGLTVYQSDYLYENLKSKDAAIEYRKNIVRKYENFVDEENAIAVKEFLGRYNSATQVIGYGKVMMIFHMLAQELGLPIVNEGLKTLAERGRFQYISWMYIKGIFEELSGENLVTFFSQWIERKDVLDLEIGSFLKEGDRLSIEILQKTQTPYVATVPVRISFQNSEPQWERVKVRDAVTSAQLSLKSDEVITKVEIDPEFELMRRPFSFENPATLSKFWGRRDATYLASYPESAELAKGLNEVMSQYDNRDPNAKISFFDPSQKGLNLGDSTFIFLPHTDLAKPFFSMLLAQQDKIKVDGNRITLAGQQYDLSQVTLALSFETGHQVVVLYVSPESQSPVTFSGKLSHFSKYSYLLLDERGRRIDAGIW